MAALTVWVTYHLMGPVTILHTQPILTVRMAVAEDSAAAEDLAAAEDSAEDLAEAEDGGKFYD